MKVAICGIEPDSVHFRTYVDYLVERGHEVTVITNKAEMAAPVKVVNVARAADARRWYLPPGVRGLPRMFRLGKALRSQPFDVLDVMQVSPDGVYAALLWRGPLLLDFWGSDILRLEIRPWLIRRLMRRAIRRAERIHSVSSPMTALLVSLGAEAARIETFQYGVDLTRFAAAPAPRASQRILSSRGLRDFYRLETIIAALPAVLAERPAAQLAITGAGEQLPGLRALAARLGVAAAVDFLGYVPEEELVAELQRAAVWVSVPPSDGTPLSLLEAMACGALPVVSDLATVREWLDEGRAVFVSQVTPEGLAAALLRGLALAETGAYAEPNRRLVEERGDRARNLPRWERLLAAAAGRALP